jgi:phosphoglycolate phosphatase-like HAD superfamily hydrolase/ADP-ribose pyrophosphatase YjhB (NUDIX family)
LYCPDGKRRYTPRVIRNLIFDWSGTLVDDLPAVWRATNYVLRRARRAEMTLDQFRASFCLPFTNFYRRHVPHIPLPQLEDWYHRRFKQVSSSVRELSHAREFLEFCRARNLRAFLLSSVRRDHYAAQSAMTGFGQFFESPYVEVRDKRKKIHEILEKNRLQAAETLFVGDMQHDIETARLGGLRSCAVLTGYNTLEQLRAAEPDLIVEHLGELRRLFEQGGIDGGGVALPGNEESRDARRLPNPLRAGRVPTATVGALVFNRAGEALLVRTHKWSDLWGIPGGKIKWGEPALKALRREIKEETNLAITDIEYVLVQDCIHPKEFYRDAHFILLNYRCRAVGKLDVRLNEEAREFRWVQPEQALTLPINQPTRRLLAVVLAKRKGRRRKKGKRSHVENQLS